MGAAIMYFKTELVILFIWLGNDRVLLTMSPRQRKCIKNGLMDLVNSVSMRMV